MLLHATGFHGRCWLPLAPALGRPFQRLVDRSAGPRRVGQSPDGDYEDWSLFVDDLFAVLEALGLDGWRGVGHSLGGAVLLLAEQRVSPGRSWTCAATSRS